MDDKELEGIVQEITGRDDYKITKPWFKKVYRLEENEGLFSKIVKNKAVRTCVAGIALGAASIPAQTALDYLIPNHKIVATAEASQPRVELEFNETDAIVLGTNILFNALMGGFGAHLENNPHSRFWRDPHFWRGARQGAIGGIPVYAGEKIMTFQNEFDYAILLGKQISDLGTSITFSAALGENWLENPRYMTDIGPLVLSWNKERGLKPELFVLPDSAVYMIYGFSQYDLNLEQSLKTGLLVFNGTGTTNDPDNPRFGKCMGNIVFVDPTRTPLDNTPAFNYNITLAHEAMHTRGDYFMFLPLDAVINHYLKKAPGKLKLLGYENHPFRLGAAVGGGLQGNLSDITFELGVEYSNTPTEFSNFHLFNFEE